MKQMPYNDGSPSREVQDDTLRECGCGCGWKMLKAEDDYSNWFEEYKYKIDSIQSIIGLCGYVLALETPKYMEERISKLLCNTADELKEINQEIEALWEV